MLFAFVLVLVLLVSTAVCWHDFRQWWVTRDERD